MTSEATKDKTREYFERKHYFGLKSENVKFFEQGTLPCLTLDGKIILENKGKIATAPGKHLSTLVLVHCHFTSSPTHSHSKEQ